VDQPVAAYCNIPWIAAIFYGLKRAVLAIVGVAVIRIGLKALKTVSRSASPVPLFRPRLNPSKRNQIRARLPAAR
jgi:hypothetical protein